MIELEKDYSIEIEGKKLYKLKHEGQVVAPFADVEEFTLEDFFPLPVFDVNDLSGATAASINGSWIALNESFNKLVENGKMNQNPLMNHVAALSVGIVEGEYIVDLDYKNDSNAQVDLNIVLNDNFEILEIQGTAEKKPFSKEDLDKLFEITKPEIEKIITLQKD